MIAGERAHEPAREIAAEGVLQPIASRCPRQLESLERLAVLKQQLDRLRSVRVECGCHVPSIDVAAVGGDPLPE